MSLNAGPMPPDLVQMSLSQFVLFALHIPNSLQPHVLDISAIGLNKLMDSNPFQDTAAAACCKNQGVSAFSDLR
jgi:hypothetical protein